MKKRSLGFNTFLNGIRSVLNIIFPLITFPYVSRILSVKGMGIYNFSNTYVGYFILLAGLGVSTYAVREGTKYRDKKNKLEQFSSQVFTINIYSTILSYLLLIISLIIFKNLNNYVSGILVFSIQIVFTTIGTEWIYTIYEDFTYITIRSIIFQFLSIILLFLLVKRPQDYLWYAAITVFSSVGANIFNFLHARSSLKITFVKNANFKLHLKPILIIFASSVATTLYVSSDMTILGLLKSDYEVGIYSVSVKIYTIITGLINGLLTATIPRLSMLFGQGRKKEYNSILSKLINSVSILIIPAATGVIMLSKEVVLLVAGKKYLASIFSLQIIVLTLLFSLFSVILTYCVLIPAKREKEVLKNTVIVGILNLIFNFILIPIWSYDGAALTTVLSEIIIVVLDAKSAKDLIKYIMFSKDFLHNILASLIGSSGIVLICYLCDMSYSSLVIKTLMSIGLSVPLYVAILVFLQNSVIMEWIKILRKRIRDKF